MTVTTNAMDLMAGYDAYASISEVDLGSFADAPATSPVCAISALSSWYCASAAGGAVGGATYHLGC